jgi:hypothetical protein
MNAYDAATYGVDEALFLNRLRYYIGQAKSSKREDNLHEGRYWIYNPSEKFQEIFPFFSFQTLRRITENLKKEGLLIVGHFNKVKFDRTNWYTLSEEWTLASNDLDYATFATIIDAQRVNHLLEPTLVKCWSQQLSSVGANQPIPMYSNNFPKEKNTYNTGCSEQQKYQQTQANEEVSANASPSLRSGMPDPFVIKNKSEVKTTKSNIDPKEIVSLWNSMTELKKCSGSEGQLKDIAKSLQSTRLRSYSMDCYLTTFKNYNDVLSDPESFFKYKWTLPDFLKRKNTDRFFDPDFDAKDYKRIDNRAEWQKARDEQMQQSNAVQKDPEYMRIKQQLIDEGLLEKEFYS